MGRAEAEFRESLARCLNIAKKMREPDSLTHQFMSKRNFSVSQFTCELYRTWKKLGDRKIYSHGLKLDSCTSIKDLRKFHPQARIFVLNRWGVKL